MFRKFIWIFTILFIIIINLIFYLKSWINWQTQPFIKNTITELPSAEVVIVPGAFVWQNKIISDIFQDRLETAIKLYKTGKVNKILISGDHGKNNYDEVNTAKNYLLEKGIKSEDIFLDHAGFDTYDTLYRAREIFQISSAIVVTQKFHMPRVIYIGKKLNLNIFGYPADLRVYRNATKNAAREYLACVKAYFNIIINSKPKFLGPTIPITGTGQLSWD